MIAWDKPVRLGPGKVRPTSEWCTARFACSPVLSAGLAAGPPGDRYSQGRGHPDTQPEHGSIDSGLRQRTKPKVVELG